MRRIHHGLLAGLLSLGLCAAGCEGDGTGQVTGTLFMRGCQAFDPTMPGSSVVPDPLPSYSLDPTYFFASPEVPVRYIPSEDPPGIRRLIIRLQNSSHQAERTDTMEFLVYDVDSLFTLQGQAMAHGEPGMPITPPPLDQDPTPPPPNPDSTVRASLQLNASCPYPPVAPMLRGYVHFTSIGTNPGDTVAADFAVTIEDLRAVREQGTPPPSPDVAGALQGSFSFPIALGPAAQGF
jgi:hypothetical protein